MAVSNPAVGRELGYAEITADFTGSAVAADVTGLTVTVTVGSRPIVIESGCPGIVVVNSGATAYYIIYEGATVIQQAECVASAAGARWPVKIRRRIAPSAGSHTYKVNVVTTVGSMTVRGAATTPAWLQVLEV